MPSIFPHCRWRRTCTPSPAQCCVSSSTSPPPSTGRTGVKGAAGLGTALARFAAALCSAGPATACGHCRVGLASNSRALKATHPAVLLVVDWQRERPPCPPRVRSVHGNALKWLVWVEDSANEHIYHSGTHQCYSLFSRASMCGCCGWQLGPLCPILPACAVTAVDQADECGQGQHCVSGCLQWVPANGSHPALLLFSNP